MRKHFKTLFALMAFSLLVIGLTGCDDGATEPEGGGNIEEPPELSITDQVADGLQSNSYEAWVAVNSMASQAEMGNSMYTSIYTSASQHNGEFSMTHQGLTIIYSARAETQDGVEGTAWTLTYDGQYTGQDTSVTFDNATVFSGWTANDGSQGHFTYDYGAYTEIQGSGPEETFLYEVNWSTDDAGTITVTSELTDSDENITQTLVVHEDGSGQYSYAGDVMYEWDANGELVNG